MTRRHGDLSTRHDVVDRLSLLHLRAGLRVGVEHRPRGLVRVPLVPDALQAVVGEHLLRLLLGLADEAGQAEPADAQGDRVADLRVLLHRDVLDRVLVDDAPGRLLADVHEPLPGLPRSQPRRLDQLPRLRLGAADQQRRHGRAVPPPSPTSERTNSAARTKTRRQATARAPYAQPRRLGGGRSGWPRHHRVGGRREQRRGFGICLRSGQHGPGRRPRAAGLRASRRRSGSGWPGSWPCAFMTTASIVGVEVGVALRRQRRAPRGRAGRRPRPASRRRTAGDRRPARRAGSRSSRCRCARRRARRAPARGRGTAPCPMHRGGLRHRWRDVIARAMPKSMTLTAPLA